MIKHSRFIGGILLVAGTTIGAGMLALPIITAFMGFYPSLILFFLCWLLMMATAFFFLDVNLSFEGEVNLITMAGKTLGRTGKVLSWVFYLLLLYALLAAYIAASTPLFATAIKKVTGFEIPTWAAPFSLPVLFGSFLYLGTLGIDYLNRLLMLGLILSYFLLVGFVPSYLQPDLLKHVNWKGAAIAIPVIITSFGFHIIIPSLTTYLKHDVKQLRWTIILGSAIPFVIYAVWQLLILGVVPIDRLTEALKVGSDATVPLSEILQSPWISQSARFFSFFAIVTSFLGVSLALSDFLTDGFKIKKSWEGRLIACLLTFIPPIVFVFSYQRGFYLALEYAGAFVAVLLGILPALMAWKIEGPAFYRTFLGRSLLFLTIVLSSAIVIMDILEHMGLV
jgi:tyrosine-specific transport protein